MSSSEASRRDRSALVEQLLQYGQKAFDPASLEETRRLNKVEFRTLIERTGTISLIPVLNTLVQPGRTEPWLRAPIVAALATLPLRERGVQDTIEFILSVHPSNAGYNTATKAGRGSSITHEALNAASKLLSTPPANMSPDEWFSGLAPQLFSLLQGEGEPEMDRAAAFIIGFGVLGRKLYGAPGTSGWRAFVEPIFRSIDPSLVPDHKTAEQEILTLGPRILVTSTELRKALQRLTSLVTIHPHPSLTRRLLRPLLLPLWSLSSWRNCSATTEKSYQKPAEKLLKTLLRLSTSAKSSEVTNAQPSILTVLTENLLFDGSNSASGWVYSIDEDGEIKVQERTENARSNLAQGDISILDDKAHSLVKLIAQVPDMNYDISLMFLKLCSRWLSSAEETSAPSILTRREVKPSSEEVKRQLVEAKIMQKMMSEIPEKLVDDSKQVLSLVDQILSNFERDDAGHEDILPVALSLLNLVLASTKFRETEETEPLTTSIKSSLSSIGNRQDLESSSTARNLLLLMKYRKELEDPAAPLTTATQKQTEDRKAYSLALSYLTSIDSPPPVRVQGLDLISGLVKANSAIIDVPAVLILFSSLLQDGDEYIYLRVIKSFIELSNRHPKAVMKDLIERYVDPNEDSDLDRRLRFGEALLQTIQSSKQGFQGDIARTVCEGLLSIAGRRGYRPKFEKEQEKKARLQQQKNKEAEDAWDGEVLQFDDPVTPENEILAQIVLGWESKRGTEDVRIRASSLSILGDAIESNVAGIGSSLISTSIDLGIHILTLEPEPEKGILRRSAILLIMSFVRALDTSRSEGVKLGFGFAGQSLDDVQRILKYVEQTDNDGLVRQHARDVVEGLQTWQMNGLVPMEDGRSEIQQLAGLSVRPLGRDENTLGRRPRIEEIE